MKALITRVLHAPAALIYCKSESGDSYVFEPDKIINYTGYRLNFTGKYEMEISVGDDKKVLWARPI